MSCLSVDVHVNQQCQIIKPQIAYRLERLQSSSTDYHQWIKFMTFMTACICNYVSLCACVCVIMRIKCLPRVIWEQAVDPLLVSTLNRSTIFVGWRQCTHLSSTRFFGRPNSPSQMAARSFQPFLHGRCHSPHTYVTLRHRMSSRNLPFPVGGSAPSL